MKQKYLKALKNNQKQAETEGKLFLERGKLCWMGFVSVTFCLVPPHLNCQCVQKDTALPAYGVREQSSRLLARLESKGEIAEKSLCKFSPNTLE